MASEILNEIEYATYKLDSTMRIYEIDERFTQVTGYTEEDIRERAIYQADLIFEEDRDAYFAMVQKGLETTGEAFIEHRIKCKDGGEKAVFCLGHAALDENGKPISVVRCMDVTDLVYMRVQAARIRKENDDELEEWMKIANTDELTGVLRRGAFLPMLNELDGKGTEYALFIVDADNFKDVNDNCGHRVGDNVLQALAKVFQDTVSGWGKVCRIGGDEFAILLESGDREKVQAVAGQIIDEVDKLQHITDGKAPVHVSIGGAIHTADSAADSRKMFTEADEALYAAKEQGKNRYVIR